MTEALERQRPSFVNMDEAMVTVKVGPDAKPFRVYRELICHYSGYFRGAFQGGFTEADLAECILSETSVRTFGLFLDWVYHQKLTPPLEPYGTTQTSKAAEVADSENSPGAGEENSEFKEKMASLASIEVGAPKIEPGEFSDVLENLSQWHIGDLIDLYIFADQHEVCDLRNESIIMLQLAEKSSARSIAWWLVAHASNNLPPNSTMCKYLVKLRAATWNFKKDSKDGAQQRSLVASTFFHDLSELLWKRLDECAGLNQFVEEGRESIRWCDYHEHADEKAAKCCEARCDRMRDALAKAKMIGVLEE